jgi:hypothetical protein
MTSMKALLLATAVVATATSAYADGHNTPPPVYGPVCSVVNRTHDGFLALRAGPGISFPMLTQLYPGDVVFETGEYASGWVHVNYTVRRGQLDGWVHGNYTENVGCPDIAMPPQPPPVPVQVPVPAPYSVPQPYAQPYPYNPYGYPQQQQNGPVQQNGPIIVVPSGPVINNNNNNR